MVNIGKLVVTLTAKTSPFSRGIKGANQGLERLSKRVKTISANLMRMGVRLVKWGALIGAGLGGVMIKLAMDAEESENLFEVSMGRQSESARRWSRSLSDSLGLNAYALRGQIGTWNVMLKSMGLGEEAAYDMSKGLVQLAYDMASFYNLKPDEAFEKLRAGITGEAEPLKRLGILVSANTIKTLAYTRGIARQGQKLTELQKVQARYAAILKQTTSAQGDLARTGHSATNQLRSLKERVTELGTDLGKNLLPGFLDTVSTLNDWVTANRELIKQKFAEWVGTAGTVTAALVEHAKKLPAAFAKVTEWWETKGQKTFEAITRTVTSMAEAVAKVQRVMDLLSGKALTAPEQEMGKTASELLRLQERRAGLVGQIEVRKTHPAQFGEFSMSELLARLAQVNNRIRQLEKQREAETVGSAARIRRRAETLKEQLRLWGTLEAGYGKWVRDRQRSLRETFTLRPAPAMQGYDVKPRGGRFGIPPQGLGLQAPRGMKEPATEKGLQDLGRLLNDIKDRLAEHYSLARLG